MSYPLETSLIRILNPSGVPMGAGVLVAPRLIATCAHVVEEAGSAPGQTVQVVFHFNGESCTARVDGPSWRSPDGEDIAILELEGNPPEGAVPALLGSSRGSAGHSFQTYGFPKIGDILGLPGGGEILGETTHNGVRTLSLRSQEVTPGFSGAPVYDTFTRRVVGLITSIASTDAYNRLSETAFAVPSEALSSACPQLQPITADVFLTQAYLKACEQEWASLPAGDTSIPLTDVYVMLQAVESRPHPPLEPRPDLPPLTEREEHAGLPEEPRRPRPYRSRKPWPQRATSPC